MLELVPHLMFGFIGSCLSLAPIKKSGCAGNGSPHVGWDRHLNGGFQTLKIMRYNGELACEYYLYM